MPSVRTRYLLTYWSSPQVDKTYCGLRSKHFSCSYSSYPYDWIYLGRLWHLSITRRCWCVVLQICSWQLLSQLQDPATVPSYSQQRWVRQVYEGNITVLRPLRGSSVLSLEHGVSIYKAYLSNDGANFLLAFPPMINGMVRIFGFRHYVERS